jgi:hypothetical protein
VVRRARTSAGGSCFALTARERVRGAAVAKCDEKVPKLLPFAVIEAGEQHVFHLELGSQGAVEQAAAIASTTSHDKVHMARR